MYKNILVATDGSRLSTKAIKAACQIASAVGAKVTGFYARPAFSASIYPEGGAFGTIIGKARFEKHTKEQADDVLEQVRKEAKKAGVETALVSEASGQPYKAIIKAAKTARCDLIVMASHGRRGLAGLLIGSETQKVLTHSAIPVLVIR